MSAQLPVEVHWVKAPEAETREDRDLVERTAREIIEAVRSRGDDALDDALGVSSGVTASVCSSAGSSTVMTIARTRLSGDCKVGG